MTFSQDSRIARRGWAAAGILTALGLTGAVWAQEPSAPPVVVSPPASTPPGAPTPTVAPPPADSPSAPQTSALPPTTTPPPAVNNGGTPLPGEADVPQPSAATPPTPLPTKAPDTSVAGVKPNSVKPATLFNGQTPGQPLPGDPATIRTLDDAIAFAFQHSPSILLAQETAIQTIEQVDQIKAIGRPQISASGNYSRLANPVSSVVSGGATPSSISNPFAVGLTTTPPGTTPIALSSSTSSSGSSVNTATGTSTSSGSVASPTTSTTTTAGSTSTSSGSSSSGTTRGMNVGRQTTTTSGGTTSSTGSTNAGGGSSSATDNTGSSSAVSSGTDLNQESARITVSELIDITGIVRVAEKYGDLQEALSRLELARIRQQTAYNVRNAYYNLLRAQAFVAVDESAVADSRELLRVTKAQLKYGVAAQYDVLTAQTQLDNNVQALISAKNQVALSKNAFAYEVGLDPSTPVDPQQQPIPPMPTLAEEDLIRQAFQQRPESLESDLNLLKAGLNIRLSHRNLEPYLDAAATAGYDPSASAFASSKASASIGLTLTYPLYDGGATRDAVDQAKSAQRGALIQKDQFIKGIKAEVQQSIIAVNDANEEAGNIASTVTEATEGLKLANVRFRAGVGTQLDVNNAQAQLVQAQSNQVNAQYDYLGALARLQLAVGAPE